MLSGGIAVSGRPGSNRPTAGLRGIVLSASDKQPIIGAAIVESGTSNGTSTGVDGRFAIETASGAEIEVTFLGYVPQKLKTRPEMQVLLQEDTQSLDEVVVTGYSTQRKADLTGAISIVNVAEMKALPDTDPMRALQGRIPGMTITADGSPSGIGTIRIRGIGSINSTKDPLFVIDGVPTQSSLNSLNANDIESIQVLKDAASASIYGSRRKRRDHHHDQARPAGQAQGGVQHLAHRLVLHD